jgi:hypothetical protein
MSPSAGDGPSGGGLEPGGITSAVCRPALGGWVHSSAERPEGLMSHYYDYLIQSRQHELIREADRHRLVRAVRSARTSRLQSRRSLAS